MKHMQKSEVQEIACKKCRDLWPMSKCNQHVSTDEGTVMFEDEMGNTVRIGENDTKRKLRQAWEKVLRESKKND